jgi:hypothetical protein
LARDALGEPVSGGRRSAVSWLRRAAWVVIPLAVAGELGHQLLERAGQAVAHHLFHILFGFGAAVAFGIYVLIDIRRHGWPTFSWRIRPPERERRTAPRP